jgi:hypothetical protein
MHSTIVYPALLDVWRRVRGRKYPWLDCMYGGIAIVMCLLVAVLLHYDRDGEAVVVIIATYCIVAILSVALVIIGPRLFK